MIRLDDTFRLAWTKRRTRKIRTGFTVAIAGLLFSLLMLALFITGGFVGSAERLMAQSMSHRFIIGGSKAYQSYDYNAIASNPANIQKAVDEHKALIEDKKREAKRLNIDYDPQISDSLPYETVDGKKQLSHSSPIAQKIINEEIKKTNPDRTFADFKTFANAYHPTAYYEVKPFTPSSGALAEMKNGKENFDQNYTQDGRGMSGMPPDYQSAQLVPKALISNYTFSQYKWQPASGHIPVVVNQKRAAELAGMPLPKSDTPPGEALQYAKRLRDNVNGRTFDVCYRNSKSAELLQQAIKTNKDIAANAGNKDYVKPQLIYDMPSDTSCGPVTIKQDTRSAEQKRYDTNVNEFNAKFNGDLSAIERKITYEVVGVSPGSMNDMMGDGYSMDFTGMLTMIMGSTTFSMAVPQELYQQIPAEQSYANVFEQARSTIRSDMFDFMSGGSFFAEFDNAQNARDFVKKESCQYRANGCEPKEKWFIMQPFGSNSIALDEMKHTGGKVLLIAGAIIAAIAAVIAGLTIGRTIADGRRETAVFRAIGFKRLDIAQIYSTYGLLLCIDIAVFALIVGAIGAVIIDHFLWVPATVRSRLMLGLYESTTEFHFIELTVYHALAVAAVFMAGIAGMAIPLLRNVRRNPIKDMRDE